MNGVRPTNSRSMNQLINLNFYIIQSWLSSTPCLCELAIKGILTESDLKFKESLGDYFNQELLKLRI